MPISMPTRVVPTAVAGSLVLLAAPAVRPDPAPAASPCAGASSRHLSVARANGVLFCLVNYERTRHGLAPLATDGRLARVAGVHARDMVRYHFVGHDSPVHGGLKRRVLRSGYRGTRSSWSFGEILGAGAGSHGTPAHIVRVWMHRPIHRRAILYRSFSRMGVGGTRGMPSNGRVGRNYVITFGG